MKKTIAILLIFLLAISLCACKDDEPGNNNNPPVNPQNPSGNDNPPVNPQDPSGGDNPNDPTNPNQGNDPQPQDPKDVISGPAQTDAGFITDAYAGDVRLSHITLSSYPDSAEALLDFAYQALESVFSKAKVTALYEVPLGLAGQYSSFDPVLIKTDSEEFNKDPLFMVPLCSMNGFSLIGTFFGSDVENGNYVAKCEEIHTFFINTLLSKNGLLGKDIRIEFSGDKLHELELKPASEEFIRLYQAANERLLTFYTGDVISDNGWQTADEDGRCKVDLYNLKSLDDVKNWVGEYFTEELVNLAVNDNDAYIEKNGALWTYPAGIGDNMSIENIRPKFMAQKNDSTMALIVELTRIEFDESWDNITGRHYEEYYFELTNTPQGWKFSDFKDVCFGFI